MLRGKSMQVDMGFTWPYNARLADLVTAALGGSSALLANRDARAAPT